MDGKKVNSVTTTSRLIGAEGTFTYPLIQFT